MNNNKQLDKGTLEMLYINLQRQANTNEFELMVFEKVIEIGLGRYAKEHRLLFYKHHKILRQLELVLNQRINYLEKELE